MYIEQLKNPSPLASDYLTIPPPSYLRMIYPEEKTHGIDTIERFFKDVELEANRYIESNKKI